MERDLELSFQQESPADFPPDAAGVVRYPHLALSGGGANGAFGAGFLNGWSATGRRPVFKIITGVSTGALMAPFAFLGPEYDAALHQFYTTTATRDVFAIRSLLLSLLRGDSLADTGPLAALIAQHVIDAFAQREQASLHWVTIDESVDLSGAEVFDPVKMAELYELGYEAARAGSVWSTAPLGVREERLPP